MNPRLKKVVIGVVVLGLVIQFIPTVRSNPEQRETPDAPPEVVTLLQRACYECHSNETTWPWYTKVAPFSWLAADDVSGGRKHLNFSEWSKYSAKKQAHKKEECWEEIESGEMPLWFYMPLHPEAKFTPEEMELLHAWGKPGGNRDEGDEAGEHDEGDED